MCRAGASGERMTDPLTGPPEPLPTRNTRRSAAIDAGEKSEPRDAPRTRRQTRLEEDNSHVTSTNTEPESSGTSNGRVTTKEIRQIIEQLQHTINKQSVLIQATRTELRDVTHSQSYRPRMRRYGKRSKRCEHRSKV